MPTIDELPTAVPLQGTDEVPVSQAGVTRSVAISALLAGVQPFITMSPGALLGRCAAGDGPIEIIVVGAGLSLGDSDLAANGSDHLGFGLQSDLAAIDEIVGNSAGHPCRLPIATLRQLYSAGANVAVSQSGVISASSFRVGQGAPGSATAQPGDTYLDSTTGALWTNGAGGWSQVVPSILPSVLALSAVTQTAAPAILLASAAASVGIAIAAATSVVRITGTVSAQSVGNGDSIVWDIAAAAKRAGASAPIAMIGTPSVSVFAADASMSACAIGLAAIQDGLNIVASGLDSREIRWNANLTILAGVS